MDLWIGQNRGVSPQGKEKMAKQLEQKLAEASRLSALSQHQKELFKRLVSARRDLAYAESIPAFQILTNDALISICEQLPLTEESLAAISGIGRRKAQAYGADFLPIIRALAMP